MADTARTRLGIYAARIFDDTSTPGEVLGTCEDLYDMCCSLVGLTANPSMRDDSASYIETKTRGGMAISPFDAARCVVDFTRTRAFGLGLRDAIRAAQARFPGERIRVLYAGTGPFATIASLQLPYFGADELSFTMLDLHETSVAAVKRLFNALEADAYIEALHQADATGWAPPQDTQYHILVSEVMQRALIREPQVLVTQNLASFLRPGALLVPEDISLELRLYDPGELYGRVDGPADDFQQVSLGRVFSVSMDALDGWDRQGDHIALHPLKVGALDRSRPLNILAHITVFGDHVIPEHASGLTLPELVRLPRPLEGGEILHLSYCLGADPGLHVTVAT